MRLTAATICLNQAQFVGDAIESVLTQEGADVEYIVVDAGSSDGSRDVIDAYGAQISLKIFEPDDGPADGLNKALRRATGDIAICVNADDVLLPGAAREAAGLFERHPGTAVVFGHGYVIDGEGKVTRRVRSDGFTPRRYVYGGSTVVQQATFFRLDAFRAVGGFNSANRTCWDGELLVELALAGFSLRRVNRTWGAFRLHPASISGSGSLAVSYERDKQRLFERVLGRTEARRDRVGVVAARVLKWSSDPLGALYRVVDQLRDAPARGRKALG
jgi:glycosyltransferase involved in cell wall biosynthesis